MREAWVISRLQVILAELVLHLVEYSAQFLRNYEDL